MSKHKLPERISTPQECPRCGQTLADTYKDGADVNMIDDNKTYSWFCRKCKDEWWYEHRYTDRGLYQKGESTQQQRVIWRKCERCGREWGDYPNWPDGFYPNCWCVICRRVICSECDARYEWEGAGESLKIVNKFELGEFEKYDKPGWSWLICEQCKPFVEKFNKRIVEIEAEYEAARKRLIEEIEVKAKA